MNHWIPALLGVFTAACASNATDSSTPPTTDGGFTGPGFCGVPNIDVRPIAMDFPSRFLAYRGEGDIYFTTTTGVQQVDDSGQPVGEPLAYWNAQAPLSLAQLGDVMVGCGPEAWCFIEGSSTPNALNLIGSDPAVASGHGKLAVAFRQGDTVYLQEIDPTWQTQHEPVQQVVRSMKVEDLPFFVATSSGFALAVGTQLQRFDANLQPMGEPVVIEPPLSMAAAGDTVALVVRDQNRTDAWVTRVDGANHVSAAVKMGGRFDAKHASIAGNAFGAFVVVWADEGAPQTIWTRTIAADGTPLGNAPVQVLKGQETMPYSYKGHSAVVASSTGFLTFFITEQFGGYSATLNCFVE